MRGFTIKLTDLYTPEDLERLTGQYKNQINDRMSELIDEFKKQLSEKDKKIQSQTDELKKVSKQSFVVI